MAEGDAVEGGVTNVVGSAHGPVVQSRVIHGDVNIHQTVALPAPPSAVGRPISEWTARELGVHESITLDSASAGLPCYVARRHDEVIRGLLRDAAEGTLMLVLAGGSASGKTRAAYEALRQLPHLRSWPVVRPAGPRQLVDLLAGGVPPGRVLWLHDFQRRFLDLLHGSAVAEGLVEALSGPGPVLVVADLWTAHWNVLVDVDSPQAGRRAQVRTLVDLPQVRMVRIADSFADASESERAELTRCAARDRRLALAVRTAGRRLEITQVLSGGPQLLRYYGGGLCSPQTHAVITAAMDARRLGYESALTVDVLRAAVAGYLDTEDRVVTGDWFADALAGATRPHFGVAALTPTRQGPGLGPPDGYVLHDFLDHHARDARAFERPPASLWTALADHVTTVGDLSRLAAEALQRGLYRLAARCAVPPAESGDVAAIRLLAVLFELRGAEAEAHRWKQRSGDLDRAPLPFDLLAWEDGAEPDKSEPSAHRLATAGNSDARWQLLRSLEKQGRDDEVLTCLQRLAESGDALAVSMLSVRLRRLGREQEAETLLRSHAQAGDPAAMWYLAHMLSDSNRIDEAVGWFRRSAELSPLAVPLLPDVLAGLGRLEDAEAPLRTRLRNGYRSAAEPLADVLERLGRVDEAEAVLRVHLEETSDELQLRPIEPRGMEPLTRLLDEAGRATEADQLRRYGIEPGGSTAAPWELPPPPCDA
jgi:tetratricopeptide (TPR) repeat protein